MRQGVLLCRRGRKCNDGDTQPVGANVARTQMGRPSGTLRLHAIKTRLYDSG